MSIGRISRPGWFDANPHGRRGYIHLDPPLLVALLALLACLLAQSVGKHDKRHVKTTLGRVTNRVERSKLDVFCLASCRD